MHRSFANVPLRLILIAPFVLQIMAAVGVTAWFSIRNGRQAVDDLARRLQAETATRINSEVDDLLSTTRVVNDLSVDTIQREDLDLNQIRSVEAIYWDHLRAFPKVLGLGLGNPQGDILGMFQRPQNGESRYFLEYSSAATQGRYVSLQLDDQRQVLRTNVTDRRIDARQRPWYQAAIAAQGPVWTDVYTSVSKVEGHFLAINASQPIYAANGELQGVASVILDLGQVSQILEDIEVSPSGQVYIMDANGQLIGSSDGKNPVLTTPDGVQRLPATRSAHPLIQTSATYLQEEFGETLRPLSQPITLDFDWQGDRRYLQVTPITHDQLPWYVVVVIPQSDFLGQIQANTRQTLWLCLAALALAIGSGILMARWVTQPLLRLNQAAKNITQGSLQTTHIDPSKLAINRTREISELSSSFGHMTQQLQASFAALQASEANYRSIAANVPGAIFRYRLYPDGSDQVLYMSPGCYDLWEVTAEVVERDASVLWHMVDSEDLPALQASVMASAQALQRWNGEWRITTPSGQRKWLQGIGQPMPQADDSVLWNTVILDVSDRKRAEEQLRRLTNRLELATQSAQFGIWDWDVVHDRLIWDDRMYALYGLVPDDFEEALHAWQTSIHPDDTLTVQQALEQALDGTQDFDVEFRVVWPDGTIRYIEAHATVERDAEGQPRHMVGVNVDITERKVAETQLRDLSDRLGLAAQATNLGIWEWDIINDVVVWDDRMCAIYSLDPHEFEATYAAWQARVHPDDWPHVLAIEQQFLAGACDYQLEFRIVWPDGGIRHVAAFGLMQHNAQGQPVRMVGTNLDISDRKQAEAQMLHGALHDSLTDLPNRTLLINRVNLAIARRQDLASHRFAILFLDLDQFKLINDSLGHLIGDQLLINVAQKLRGLIRPTDVAARLGGDEFVILLEHLPDQEAVVRFAQRILTAFEGVSQIDGISVFMTTSIGIVWGTPDYTDAVELLRDADIALYRAKAKGRNTYAIFDVEMHTSTLKRMTLEHDLRLAIAHHQFVPHYQPIVDLSTRQIIGFEALLRWQHPTRGFVPPDEFIPVAEETRMITAISRWMLYAACEQTVRWQRELPQAENLRISVNLSGQDLEDPTLIDTIRQTLAHTQLAAASLTLEITESMLVKDIEDSIDMLQQLRDLGIRISIDDFGTGYSSLSYLYNLPADYLKIDKSFVGNMHYSDKNYKIVQAVVALSDQLQIAAIAEGIETPQQMDWLQQLRCELGQGYLISPPLASEAARDLIDYGLDHGQI